METDKKSGKKIQILLSTYNGEKYLREQMESYFAQENFDRCEILIRDDGSTDGTKEILREYEKMDCVRVAYGKNVGVNESYWWLLEHSDKDCAYFALSDQDDVWVPEKLRIAEETLDSHGTGRPCLFASKTQIVDAGLKDTGRSLFKGECRVSYYNAMVQNVLPGHTQVLNRRFVDLLVSRGCADVNVFDSWSYLAAAGVGEICFYPHPLVLHRQHANNTVGMYGFFGSLKRRIGYVLAGKGNTISKQLAAFYERYKELLPEEYRQETEAFITALPTLPARIRYIRHCLAFRQQGTETLLFKVLYLLGKYKL